MISVVLTVLLHERTSNFAHLFEKSNSKTKRYGPRERVVVSRSERTTVRCVFCVVFVLLWRSRRSHDAKSSKKIERYDFSVIPGAENAYFCSEPPSPMKNPQSEDETPANRPSRMRWRIKLRCFIVSDGENFDFRDFRVLESHIFGRSGQTRSKIWNLTLGPPPIDPPGSIDAL